MQPLLFTDVFSGAGLFSAGFVAERCEPVLAVDLSKDAIDTYNRNLPPVGIVKSVTEVAEIPLSDILIAGPPCQGFSTLGRRDPLDVRNVLALEVVRWARASRAKIVVIENVPPFLASAQWRELARGLGKLGYRIDTWELDAVDYGTPQLRRRAFTVASLIGRVEQPLPSPVRLTAGDALSRPIPAGDPLHVWPKPKGVAAARIPLVPPLGDKRDIMRLAPELCPPSWVKVGCQATDVWGRIDPAEPANTIRCSFQNPSKGRYLHPTEDRTLSLREGARLQGVPDEWEFVGKPYPVARQIGNGVPIPLAKAVAAAVVEAFGRQAELDLAA